MLPQESPARPISRGEGGLESRHTSDCRCRHVSPSQAGAVAKARGRGGRDVAAGAGWGHVDGKLASPLRLRGVVAAVCIIDSRFIIELCACCKLFVLHWC